MTMTTLECSSTGDRRFSALYASYLHPTLIRLAPGTIECIYQGAKRDGNHKPFPIAKGASPFYMHMEGMDYPARSVQYAFYRMLWHLYFIRRPDLLQYAATFAAYHDTFENGGSYTYAWSDAHLPEKQVQSVVIAALVRSCKMQEKYKYPEALLPFWKEQYALAKAR